MDEQTKEVLLGIIRRKLTQQAVKIRADIEVSCYGYEGIGAVKKALKAGIDCSTEEIPIKINLIAPPLYVMTTQTPERQDGIKALQIAIEKVKEVILNLDGVFQINMAVSIYFETFLSVALVFSKFFFFLISPKLLRLWMKLNWPDRWRKLNWRILKLEVNK